MNIFQTFSSVFIANFEHVIAGWVLLLDSKIDLLLLMQSYSLFMFP